MQTRPNGAFSRRQTGRDLVQPQVVLVVHGDHVPVVRGKFVECFANTRVALAGFRRGVATLVLCAVVCGTEIAKLFEVETSDEPRSVAPLRAHHHEGLVGGHPEEPGRKARVAAERTHPAHDLNERGLKEIPAVVVGDGIAQQLLFDMRRQDRDEGAERGGVAVGGSA